MRTEKKEQTLTSEEHLEAILYQFVTLYERWSEDRQVSAKQGADIAKFVKDFTFQVNHFASLEEKVRKDIHSCVKNAAENLTSDIGKSLADTALRDTAPTIDKLREATSDAKKLLNVYFAEMSTTHWKIILSTIAASLIISLTIVWFMMPKMTIALSSLDNAYIAKGYEFISVWTKLSKQEQAHLDKLFKEFWDEKAKEKAKRSY